MSYQIGDNCIHCGMCASECQTASIQLDDSGNYRIDSATCVGCGTCAEICPTENIASE